jgi:hypothetical protein
MKYEQETFDVSMGGSKEYRDSWERIFGKGREGVDEECKEDGCWLQMDGEVFLVERKDGVELSREPVDGKVILQLVLGALERGLQLAELDERGAKKRGTGKGKKR